MALALCLVTAAPASAKEVFHGFVKDQYYLIRGGTPASLEQIAANPLAIFRSQLAYDNLRAHIGSMIGRPLSDGDFRSLMRSDDVRLVSCVGSVDTSGVTDSGRFGFHRRGCYIGEMLIQVRLEDGRWLTVASQGCYNPVRGEVPYLPPPVAYAPPPPPPPALVTRYRLVPFGTGTSVSNIQGIVGGIALPNCCPCDGNGNPIVAPFLIQGIGAANTSTIYQIPYQAQIPAQ